MPPLFKGFGLGFSKSLSDDRDRRYLIGRLAPRHVGPNFSVAVFEPLPVQLYPSGKPSRRKSGRSTVSKTSCAGAEFSEGRKKANLGQKCKNVFMTAFPFPVAVVEHDRNSFLTSFIQLSRERSRLGPWERNLRRKNNERPSVT